MKNIKDNRIKLIANNPRKIKAAVRSWVASADKTDCDALNLDAAPAWAENALAEVVKIVLPSKRLPTAGEWDLELLGELNGRLQAFTKMFQGEIPMGPEMKAELNRIEKHAASLPPSPERTAREKLLAKDIQNMMDANGHAVSKIMEAALGSSHEDALKYQKGLLRGMTLASDELTTGRTFQRHTRTFWVLGTQWRHFANCRSVAEVHRIFCQAVGENQIGSLKHFESRIAKKIGMKFGRSGRPPKLK